MKIAIVSDIYLPVICGASYAAERLAIYLQQRGHEILVIAPSTSMHSGYSTDERTHIKSFRVRSFSSVVDPTFRKSCPWIRGLVKDELQRFKPDVIHVHSHFALARAAARAARELDIPIMGTNHFMPENITHYIPMPTSVERQIKRWLWEYFCGTFDQFSLVTTPTQTALQLLVDIGFKKPVQVVSNGIDLQRFHGGLYGDSLRDRYHIPKDKNILLFVGRLAKEKNIDKILEALTLALKTTDLHFVAAGSGPEANALKQKAHQLGIQNHVTFTGFVPDVDLPALYTLGYCFIIPGTAELQSIVTMEAMATGMPILGVRAMALPELILHNENGFLFELEDVTGLANNISQIFSDKELHDRLTKNGLEFIQKHDIQKIMDHMENLYKQLLAQT